MPRRAEGFVDIAAMLGTGLRPDKDFGRAQARIVGFAGVVDANIDLAGQRRELGLGQHVRIEISDADALPSRRQRGAKAVVHLCRRHVVPTAIGVAGCDLIGGDLDGGDFARRDALFPSDRDDRVQTRMQMAATGIGLDVAARDVERFSQPGDQLRRIGLAGKGLQETVLDFQHASGSSHAVARQMGGQQTLARSEAGVEALDLPAAVQEGEQARRRARRDG